MVLPGALRAPKKKKKKLKGVAHCSMLLTRKVARFDQHILATSVTTLSHGFDPKPIKTFSIVHPPTFVSVKNLIIFLTSRFIKQLVHLRLNELIKKILLKEIYRESFMTKTVSILRCSP